MQNLLSQMPAIGVAHVVYPTLHTGIEFGEADAAYQAPDWVLIWERPPLCRKKDPPERFEAVEDPGPALRAIASSGTAAQRSGGATSRLGITPLTKRVGAKAAGVGGMRHVLCLKENV